MTEHHDALETRSPAAREADLFARLPKLLKGVDVRNAAPDRNPGGANAVRSAGVGIGPLLPLAPAGCYREASGLPILQQ